jgi:integrase
VALKTNKARDKINQDLLNTPGKHCDGAGLYLSVARDEESRRRGLPIKKSKAGGASYLFRHKNKWASLGSAYVWSIKEARATAAKLWDVACKGGDPFAHLKTLRGGPTAAGGKTFAEALADYLAVKSPTWTASNRDRGLQRYAYIFGKLPVLMSLPVKAIEQADRNAALANWNGQIKVRKDVEHYINAIINHALTGKIVLKTVAVEHHKEMPYADVPAFFRKLKALGTENAKALQWAILTGARSDEVIGAKRGGKWKKLPATWGEITKEADGPAWIIPGNRIKTRQTHRVPLSKAAMGLLGERKADDAFLFAATSEGALRATLKACDGNGYKVHGFRTSFQNWILENTDYGMDIANMCIHVDKRGKNQKAYQQTDLLKKRRAISQRWSDYLTGK